ncbi:MAG: hypothetical protein JO273_07585 [Methylobacteriaceae bacterium]|nr:hypothetical protein [Methylobacteriaceae bacterium]
MAVPFFWSQHYDTVIDYVGDAEQWDRLDIDRDPAAHDCAATYWRNGKRLAVATVDAISTTCARNLRSSRRHQHDKTALSCLAPTAETGLRTGGAR